MLEMYIMMVVPRQQQQQASRQIINVFYSQKYIQVQCHYNNRQGTVRLILGFFASVLHLSTFETQRRRGTKKNFQTDSFIQPMELYKCMMIIKMWIKKSAKLYDIRVLFEDYLSGPSLILLCKIQHSKKTTQNHGPLFVIP